LPLVARITSAKKGPDDRGTSLIFDQLHYGYKINLIEQHETAQIKHFASSVETRSDTWKRKGVGIGKTSRIPITIASPPETKRLPTNKCQ
jgi:hypothetical protein